MTQLTPEELLRPRYKVIADYFYNPYKIGDIITVQYDDRSVHLTTTNYRDEFGERVEQANYFAPARLNDLPHLFQKLEWWEERKLEAMPEYVKVINEECAKAAGLYAKTYKWHFYGDKLIFIGAEIEGYEPSYLARPELNFPGQIFGRLNAEHLQPATREEYEAYTQEK